MKLKHITGIILFVVLFLAVGITASNASYSASNPTVTSGEKVTISVTSSTALDAYNLDLDNNGGLTFNSCSKAKDTDGDIISVNGGRIGYMSTSGTTKKLGTYTFTAPTVTEKKTYTVTFIVDQSTTVKSTVTVNPKPTTPSNQGGNSGGGSSNGGSSNTQTKATIKKLVVAGKTYNNPSKNITVKVDNDVTNAKISVTTSNGESYTINKGNNVKLEEGTNTVKITLASGNVYTVNIRRAAKEDDIPNIIDEPKPEEKILLKSLKLQGVNLEEEKVELSYSPEFSSEVYEYSVTIPNDITKIDVEALASNENYTVEITGNEDLQEGENIITILVKAKDSDKVTTYKIKVIKEKAEEVLATLDETPNTGEEQKGLDENIIKIVIVTFTALVAIAGIVFAIIEYNYSKKHPKEKMGKIPYSNIGFKDEETDKEDILEEVKDKKEQNEDKNNNTEEDKPKKRGKHF